MTTLPQKQDGSFTNLGTDFFVVVASALVHLTLKIVKLVLFCRHFLNRKYWL